MEDLASSLDRQNAEDLMRPPAPATPGYQLEQLIEHTEQHAPPSVQFSDSGEPPSPREASEQSSDDSDSIGVSLEETDMTGSSLEDTIRKYVPDGSDLAISLEQRQTLAWQVGDGTSQFLAEQSDLDEILVSRLTTNWTSPCLLVIQNPNIHWSKILCARFPESCSPELLAGHIIRFDKIPSTYGEIGSIESRLATLYPGAGFKVFPLDSFMSIYMDDTITQGEHRFNLDFIAGSYHGEAFTHLSKTIKADFRTYQLNNREDVFERDEQNNWRRISVRLSCIRLAADFRKIGTLTCCRNIFADDQF